jgi:hypothetical protein
LGGFKDFTFVLLFRFGISLTQTKTNQIKPQITNNQSNVPNSMHSELEITCVGDFAAEARVNSSHACWHLSRTKRKRKRPRDVSYSDSVIPEE